ncbi:hypothetical protein DENSPDRAFT_497286 [Dentipellis sp. KUC8613]|nr:hypothetical protein DENSPDRAFT_497286 [Dentipellis sp. KUC8613]
MWFLGLLLLIVIHFQPCSEYTTEPCLKWSIRGAILLISLCLSENVAAGKVVSSERYLLQCHYILENGITFRASKALNNDDSQRGQVGFTLNMSSLDTCVDGLWIMKQKGYVQCECQSKSPARVASPTSTSVCIGICGCGPAPFFARSRILYSMKLECTTGTTIDEPDNRRRLQGRTEL